MKNLRILGMMGVLLTLLTIGVGPSSIVSTAHATVFLHYSFDGSGPTPGGFVFLDDSGNNNHGVLQDFGSLNNNGFVSSPAAFGQSWNDNDPSQIEADHILFTTPFNPGTGQAWTVAFWYDMIGGASVPLFSSSATDNTFLIRADPFTGSWRTVDDKDSATRTSPTSIRTPPARSTSAWPGILTRVQHSKRWFLHTRRHMCLMSLWEAK